jgi:small GTP-binding protein
MLQKKICMLGSFAVGKTSLVRRFVESIFSPDYFTTVGAMVDKKDVQVSGKPMTMVLWDLYGEDDYQKIRWSHFGGAFGFLLVADGTRRATLDKAIELEQKAREAVGVLPFVFVINKSDLADEWEIDAEAEAPLAGKGWKILHTSAKTGAGVEEAFLVLAQAMLGK